MQNSGKSYNTNIFLKDLKCQYSMCPLKNVVLFSVIKYLLMANYVLDNTEFK